MINTIKDVSKVAVQLLKNGNDSIPLKLFKDYYEWQYIAKFHRKY